MDQFNQGFDPLAGSRTRNLVNRKNSGLIGLVLKTGVVKTTRDAQYVLLFVAAIILVVSWFVATSGERVSSKSDNPSETGLEIGAEF